MRDKSLCFLMLVLVTGVSVAGELATSGATPVRQAPRILNPKERSIGRLVPNVSFRDVAGTNYQLSDFASRKGMIIAVTSTSCPLSKKYFPTLVRLARQYQQQGFAFILLNPTATDKVDAIQRDANALGQSGIYLHDQDGTLSAALKLTSTTDALLLDPTRTVRYHGAIDDQYGFGYSIPAPRKNYLAVAIEDYLQGQPVVITATEAPGCLLDPGARHTKAPEVTYHNRISRLMQRNCVECHRDGGVAPFALETRADLIAHATMIETVVRQGTMPPWFAAPIEGQKSSTWINDCSLSSSDKEDLLAWFMSDRPEGDSKDAPQTVSYPSGWTIGKPDVVRTFPQPVSIQESGFMRYQNVIVETGLDEDKWIQGIEIRPGAPEVVHHILVFARPPRGTAQQKSSPQDEINYWAIYVPGNSKQVYPAGFARLLPKGTQLRFQMHYTPNGKATEDATQIGLIFADKAPDYEVKTASLVNAWFEIPPGADNHEDSAKFKMTSDVTVLGYLPHMHLRGKACRYEAILPDGTRETLLNVPRYDFNWQLLYRYAEPRTFAKGTTLKFYATFDNSDKNPANPDPKSTVRWGEQTYDEMLLGYIEYFVPVPKPGESNPAADSLPFGFTEEREDVLFTALDADDDEKLSREEFTKISQNPRLKQTNPLMVGVIFVSLDKDQDGMLSLEEFRQMREMFRKKKK